MSGSGAYVTWIINIKINTISVGREKRHVKNKFQGWVTLLSRNSFLDINMSSVYFKNVARILYDCLSLKQHFVTFT